MLDRPTLLRTDVIFSKKGPERLICPDVSTLRRHIKKYQSVCPFHSFFVITTN